MTYLAKIEKHAGEEGYPKDYFLVTFPSLPGCVTQGDTFTEALKNAHEALDAWLTTRCTLEHKHGPVPCPDGDTIDQSCGVIGIARLEKIRPSIDTIKQVKQKQQSFFLK